MRRLSTKQENFCLNYVKLDCNGTQAVLASGYHCKPSVAHVIAAENIRKPTIAARIDALREEIKSAAIADPIERRKRLTEIVRAKLTDFMELGQDGSWANIGPETPKAGAISEIHSRTEYDDNGAKPTVHTSVKLHNPMQAIDLLNKMDKLYAEAPAGDTVNNTQINIIVGSEKTRDLLKKINERFLTDGR